MVFYEYLFGSKFTVKSDNNLLMYVLTVAQLDTMDHHWVAQLALYDLVVLYRSGKTNIEAYALSQIDWDQEPTSEAVRGILNTVMNSGSPLAKICNHTMILVPSFMVVSGITPLETKKVMPKQMTATDCIEAQMQDQDLNQIICLYKARQLDMAKLCNFKSREIKTLLCHQLKLKLWEGVLYLKTSPNWGDQNNMRLVALGLLHPSNAWMP